MSSGAVPEEGRVRPHRRGAGHVPRPAERLRAEHYRAYGLADVILPKGKGRVVKLVPPAVQRLEGLPLRGRQRAAPNTYQKGNEFFVEKRKNILQFGEVDDIISML